ncbi:class I SAM-dependent methyltransferase [Evansella cellulosilytica]|uniref:Methyltransferase type 11 n=1 Tax=Evansella cellulosilytica (strain ATCC 21833 / DSM 2522 / FERM P-1141 / JCM 9156 / N-4) TaxID=649639 RepID=E6TX08_EVAC2|nr:class I SAM-dependent methyltransferase [Evansella cellulosilytica]ADU31097.1 Methyltransferase type 11 [Evansella cellulosilytica DSM 2522]
MKQNIYDNDQFFNGYRNLRFGHGGLNDVLEQPAIRKLLPRLHDLTILDLGCGMGQFARYCIENGAKEVIGTDISNKMLAIAKEQYAHKKIKYIHSAMEDIQFPKAYYDLVVSSLALHYVEDYQQIVSKVYDSLKPNGFFIYSIEHPICTAANPMNGWIKDENGAKKYWPVDHYQEEGYRQAHWFVDDVTKYHRTLSTLINTLIKVGFHIEEIDEPEVVPEALSERQELKDEARRPPFLIVKVRKY